MRFSKPNYHVKFSKAYIRIEHDDAVLSLRQRRSEVGNGRGLSDPALAGGNNNGFAGHKSPVNCRN